MSDPDYEPTRLIRKSSSSGGNQPPPPPQASSNDPEETVYNPTAKPGGDPADKTRIIRKDSSADEPVDDGKTKLVRPSSSKSDVAADSAELDDRIPTVGWLVVIKGRGWGESVTLGLNNNTIGRSKEENRVALPFGDSTISKKKHSIITFDPQDKKFYIREGESNNLTRVNNKPVLAPLELQGGEDIQLGETTLKFVPFCGENFGWEENG